MQRAHKLLTLGILGAAVSPVMAGPQFSGQNPGGTWNVYEVITTPMTWDQARAHATTLNYNGTTGHLVSVLNFQENGLVRAVLPGDSWLGLSDSDQTSTIDGVTLTGTEAGTSRTGGWKWVSGEPYSFHNFGSGEPNDAGATPGSPAGEDATQMRGDGLWNDHQAGSTIGQNNQTFNFVVEYPTQLAANPILSTLRAAPAAEAGKFHIREVTNNGGLGNLVDVDASLAGDRTATPRRVVDYTAPVINIHDSDGNGNFGNDSKFASAGGAGPAVGAVENLAMLASGRVRIPTSGNYTFAVNSDDGFKLTIGGKSFTGVAGQNDTTIVNGSLVFGAGRGAQNSFGHIFLDAGDYDLQLEYWEGGGGSSVELSAAQGTHTTFNTAFNLVGGPAIAQQTAPRKAGTILAPGFDVVVLRDDAGDPSDGGPSNVDEAITAVTSYWTNGNTAPAGSIASTEQRNVINYVDDVDGGGGKGRPQNLFPGNVPGVGENDFALGAKGKLQIADGGEYTFMVLGDDGSQLRLLGTSGWTSGGGSGPQNLSDGVKFTGCCSDGFAYVNLAPGTYDLEFIWNEIGGGAYVGLFASFGHHTSYNPTFQLLGENLNDTVNLVEARNAGLELVAVPEPASLSLLAVGALALFRRRRQA